MTAPAPISTPRPCAASGRPLSPGELIVAALYLEDDGNEPRRAEFSLKAWTEGARPPGPLIGRWRTRVPEPDARPRMLLDDAGLLDLFEQLDAPSTLTASPSDNPPESPEQARAREAFRFILALMLVRKRILICESSQADRITVRVRQTSTEHARGAAPLPPVEVIDPGMDERTLADVTARLTAVLSG